jgi:pimeloyl-ACP methyl ester carboxylesterase
MKSGTLIFVPGLLCTGELFAPQVAALNERYDVRIADTLSDTTIDAMADRILAQAPERFALAGLSMGGYVALSLARKAPERLEKLVLMDTSARPDTEEQTVNRRRLVELAQRSGMGPVSQVLSEKVLAERNRDDRRIRALVDGMAEEIGVETFLIQQEAIIGRVDSRPHLSAIAVPTLVIVGEEDELTPIALAREIADGLADARLVAIPEAGHMVTIEAPDAATRALEAFLAAD